VAVQQICMHLRATARQQNGFTALQQAAH
jgi:hypothetical protein